MTIKKSYSFFIACLIAIIPFSNVDGNLNDGSVDGPLRIRLTSQISEFYEPLAQFQADKGTLERKYSITESSEYYDRMTKLYNDWLEFLYSVDYDDLTYDGQVDYHLFVNLLRKELYFLKQAESEFYQVEFVVNFADELYDFIRSRRRGSTPDAQKVASAFLNSIQRLNNASEELATGKKFETWMIAGKASNVVRSLRENLSEAYDFYYGYHPEFTWWVERPFADLDRAIRAYESQIANYYSDEIAVDDGSGITGRQAGAEELARRLQFEYIPYSVEELIEIGNWQFAWCREEMLKASRELGFGDDWRAALEYVKNQHVKEGFQPEMVNGLAEQSINFLEEHDLLTIPELSKEVWRMVMNSPQRQLTAPFFLGGEAIHISYPTHEMEHQAKVMSMRGNNPHFSMATVHHELIPGHHLQGFLSPRNKPYRRPFNTAFWLEGWALYWEFLLYDMDFPQTPEDRIGFMFWRSHRAARIIFTMNYHLGNMTPQECIDFLVDEVGHERLNAAAEVRGHVRGSNHLYQISYKIGGLQLWALRHELVDSGYMSEKEFHDRILLEGSMPVELLRMVLKGESIPRDYETSWKFPFDIN